MLKRMNMEKNWIEDIPCEQKELSHWGLYMVCWCLYFNIYIYNKNKLFVKNKVMTILIYWFISKTLYFLIGISREAAISSNIMCYI